MLRNPSVPVLLVVLLALAGCGEAQPPEYVSKADKFKTRFGGDPKVTERPELRSTVYTVEHDDGARTVIVTDLAIPDEPDRVPERLKLAQDALVRSVRGKVTSTDSINLAGKFPGREVVAEFTEPRPGMMYARVYLVGRRLYQVMVVGTEDYATSPTTGAFFDSFMVHSE